MAMLQAAGRLWLSIFCCLVLGGIRAEPVSDPTPQIRLYEMQLDSMKIEHNKMLAEADLIAERMKLYQSSERLNAREHDNLSKLLRRSLVIEQEVTSLRIEVEGLLTEYDRWLSSELQAIQDELNTSSQRIGTDSKNRDGLIRIQTLLSWKALLETRRKPLQLHTDSGLQLTLEKTASSRELRLRGDMLLDREELFRKEIGQIDERIESLRIEAKVRRKVLEMTEDMDLFDEEEELFGQKSRPVNLSAMAASNAYDYWDEASHREGFLDAEGSKTGSQDGLTDPAVNASADPSLNLEFRTPEAIEAAVESLADFRDRLHVLADSLENRSRLFYNEADQRGE